MRVCVCVSERERSGQEATVHAHVVSSDLHSKFILCEREREGKNERKKEREGEREVTEYVVMYLKVISY